MVITRETVAAECERVRFVPWSEAGPYTNVHRWARAFGWDPATMWQTQRPRIYHPSWVEDPLDHWQIVAHELVHWRQQGPSWWGRLRWFALYGLSERHRYRAEREAYLVDIRLGVRSPLEVARLLRAQYRISVPEDEILEWLLAHT